MTPRVEPLLNIPLLRRLRNADGAYVSLDELGALGDDLGAVGRDVDALVAFGYQLDLHPSFGVAYRGPADRLCPDQVEADLNVALIGRRLAVWSRVTSTNDLAARAAASPANDGLVILAEAQTAGRGRRGRTWTAPAKSSILLSAVLFPPELTCGNNTTWLTALAAVATAEVVDAATGRSAQIKWPNDVRVDRMKVAGVLVEHAAGRGAVLGIGLNVDFTRDDFPDELRDRATSLAILRPQAAPFDRSELARALIIRLDSWYAVCLAGRLDELELVWIQRFELLGQRVYVHRGDSARSANADNDDAARAIPPADSINDVADVGVLESIHPRLGLTLLLDDGRRRTFTQNDIHAIVSETDNPRLC